jgi:hypothetical protein
MQYPLDRGHLAADRGLRYLREIQGIVLSSLPISFIFFLLMHPQALNSPCPQVLAEADTWFLGF